MIKTVKIEEHNIKKKVMSVIPPKVKSHNNDRPINLTGRKLFFIETSKMQLGRNKF